MRINENPNLDLSGPYEFSTMCMEDLDEVMIIEKSVHSYPWTRGNFIDSIQNKHQGDVLRNSNQVLLGYFIIMQIQKEAHLLNISVHNAIQNHGIGKMMLEKMCSSLQGKDFESILLEVKVSNERAISIYRNHGFIKIGHRRNYYLSVGKKT